MIEKKLIDNLIDKKIKETDEKIEKAYDNGDNTYCLYEILKVYETLKDDIDEIYYY